MSFPIRPSVSAIISVIPNNVGNVLSHLSEDLLLAEVLVDKLDHLEHRDLKNAWLIVFALFHLALPPRMPNHAI